MGRILDELRQEYAVEPERNMFGFKKYPKGDAMLYQAARMRDAEDEKRQLEKRVVATDQAAIDILRRYDSDGSVIREFKKIVEERIKYLQ